MENYLALDENNNNIMPAIQSCLVKPGPVELEDEASHYSHGHSVNHHGNNNHSHHQHSQLQQLQQLQHAQQIQQQTQFGQQVGASIVAGSASNSSSLSNANDSSSSNGGSNSASRTSSTSSRSSLDGAGQLTDIDTPDNKLPLSSVVLQTTTATVSSLASEFGANNHQLAANGTIAAAAFVAGGHPLQSNNHNGSIITLNANGQPAKPRGRRKKIRTEPIRPICPQCDKQFSNQSALTKHKLTHSDERKFTCQQCSKAFKRQDHLTGHMQTHSNRKPFNCTIQGCDKTYCDARSLRRHKENIHHIVTPKENGGDSNHHQHHHNHHQQSAMKVEQHNNNHHHQQRQQLDSFASNGTSCDQVQSPNGIGGSLQTLHHQQQQPDQVNHNGAANQHPIQTSHHQQQHQQPQQQPAAASVQQLQHTPSSTTLDSVGNCLQPISNRQLLSASSTTPTATPTATRWTSMDSHSHQHQDHQPNHHHHPQMHNPHHPLSGGHRPHHAVHHNHHHHLGGHYHHHQQAPYSADYTSSQHFSFDFSAPHPHMTSPMDQLVSSNISIPHSADSVVAAADNSQLVGAQQQPGGYLTPTTLHPPTPNSIGSSSNTIANNNNNNSSNNVVTGSLVGSTQFNADQQQQQPAYKQPIVPLPSFVASSTNQQPSHLLRRRFQRLHSDGATYANAADDQLGHLEPIRQQPLMQLDQQQHYQQASYSADYASTQHFSFDFSHMTHMDQPLLNGSSNTIPHSADSITDSGLGLNVQYEQQLTPSNHHNANRTNTTNTTVTNQHHHSQEQQQQQNGGYLTPTTLPPPTPNTGLLSSPQFNNTNNITATGEPTPIYHQQQQTQNSTTIVPTPSFTANSTNQQPSDLLRRRIQRLHSDSGSYTDDQSGCLDLIRQQPLDSNQAQQQHYQQASYSADYASTQHFSFDSHEDHNNQIVDNMQQTHLLGNCIE